MRTDAELLDYMLENEDTIKELYQLICIGHNSPVSRVAPGTALYYALRSGVPYNILVRFCTVLSNGFYNGASETAAVVIRNKLMAIKLSHRAEKKDMFLQTQMAIRDFTEGKPRQMLWAKAYGVYSEKYTSREESKE